ncbi:cyclophilin-like fold protein [Bacteroides sp.]|uniref:cyclophilin-like fold protein n=1 Tax=Bacteroides sp. TaxID=29523 RepID=UPI0025C0701A|nr:cyclophilin-like fold protein [Bacteroides sp.]
MMKKNTNIKYYIIAPLVVLTLLISLTSCSTDAPCPNLPDTTQPFPTVDPDKSDDNNNPDKPGNNDNSMDNNLKINIGSISLNATLEDNPTVTAFKSLLPMTVNMSEMNNNEKYYYLPADLPMASFNSGRIQTGDLMLYGSSCVVLFYKTFSTSYSYTRLGRVDNPSGLTSALGSGNVTVTFELP